MVKRCQNEECGKAFTPARRDAKFCSERCRGQANARRARAAKTVATPTPSEGRLEAIEARLEHLARSLETRLDALERSVKAARVEASQALNTVADEQGREREAARKSARDLGRPPRRARGHGEADEGDQGRRPRPARGQRAP